MTDISIALHTILDSTIFPPCHAPSN